MPKPKPAPKEVLAEIKRLKEMQPNVRAMSMFGDDNRAAIDAQIAVLEGNLGEDAVYDAYSNPDNDDDRHLLDNALEARRWLDGDSEDGLPSEGWKELVE